MNVSKTTGLWALILFFLQTSLVSAQTPAPEYATWQSSQALRAETETVLTWQQPVTSMSISLPEGASLQGAYLSDGLEKYPLSIDEDYPAEPRTRLVVFNQALTSVKLYTGQLQGAASFHLLYVKPIHIAPARESYAYKKYNCDKPQTIAQSVWRAGLPEPKNFPERTDVEHVIVHHAATSNADTNYTQVVRNIYLYHTQSNGWDDIGYNFLVAPNGWIYEGRDGRGTMPDDDVKGAHFCNKNSNTMGICMIGNYMDTFPSDTALGSLRQLIAWKLNLEALAPLDSSLHPKGAANAQYLPNIAGHRDGCATECPGDSMYVLLQPTRLLVAALMKDCQPPVTSVKEFLHMDKVLVSVRGNRLNVFTPGLAANGTPYRIISMAGQVVSQGRLAGDELHTLDISRLRQGVYTLQILGDKPVNEKFLK